MSNKIQFSDDDLKDAIISHWKSQGVTITNITVNEMVDEIKSKLKNHTLDELKLILSELKLELTPTESSLNDLFLISHSFLNFSNKFLNKTSGWGDATRNEIEIIMKELFERARKTSNSINQERKNVMKEKKNLTEQRKRIYDKINSINNFEDEDSSNQQEILNLIKTKPHLQEIINKEHQALPKGFRLGRGGIISETQKVQFSPEEIKELNESFGGGGSKELNSIKVVDKRGKITDRIIWPRKRFAFEKAIGNENTDLYQKRLGYYQQYVKLLKEKVAILNESIDNLERILVSTRKQSNLGKIYISKVVEHSHSASHPQNKNLIANAKESYVNELKQYLKEKEEIENKSIEYQQIEQELNQLIFNENIEPETTSYNSLKFDPEYLYGLSHREGTHQKSNIAPNVWSITPEGSIAPNPLENIDVSWKLGHALYDYLDTFTETTERDMNNVLKPYGEKRKVTQQFSISPYATEEQISDFENREESYVNGWSYSKKRKMAQSTANWDYLWNLSKQNVSKGDKHYKEIVQPNDLSIRNSVISNPNTPDWILMFMAETDSELGNSAENKLGQRGWKLVRDKNKNPIISDQFGTWMWTKSKNKMSGLSLSFREAQANPLQSLIDTQKELDRKNQEIEKQRQTLQTQVERTMTEQQKKIQQTQGQQSQGQQSQGTQIAKDNTTAPLPPLPVPTASRKIRFPKKNNMRLSIRESQLKENLQNIGATQITIEPSNNYVEKAIEIIRQSAPEILPPISNIRTDLNKNIFGEFSSEHPHTLFLNINKIESEVRNNLKNSSEEAIVNEIVKQAALVISHEYGHQHAFNQNKDISETPAEQKEQEVLEKLK